MPLRSYSKYFGKSPRSAERAHQALVAQYGYSKGTKIFYSMLAERRAAKKTYGKKRR